MNPAAQPGETIRVVPLRQLGAADRAAWAALQEADPRLASPFFRPEFAELVAAVRDDVFVAVMECAGEAVGFFPFQRDARGVGGPVGGTLSDYQAVIARRDFSWDAVRLVRGAGLREWRFDHLLAAQEPFGLFHRILTESPVIDLSEGYARYAEQRVRLLSEPRKRRKLEREVGPVRFEAHVADGGMLRTLMRWKGAQYEAGGKRNLFTLPWVAGVLERVQAAQGAQFSGLLSVLSAGGEPVAAHLGLRSRTVWHYWLPTYNPAFAQYSPGMLLVLEMAASAAALGVRTIDFGKGRALYKQRLANGTVALAEGVVPAAPLQAACARTQGRVRALLRRGPVRHLRAALRKLRGGTPPAGDA